MCRWDVRREEFLKLMTARSFILKILFLFCTISYSSAFFLRSKSIVKGRRGEAGEIIKKHFWALFLLYSSPSPYLRGFLSASWAQTEVTTPPHAVSRAVFLCIPNICIEMVRGAFMVILLALFFVSTYAGIQLFARFHCVKTVSTARREGWRRPLWGWERQNVKIKLLGNNRRIIPPFIHFALFSTARGRYLWKRNSHAALSPLCDFHFRCATRKKSRCGRSVSSPSMACRRRSSATAPFRAFMTAG